MALVGSPRDAAVSPRFHMWSSPGTSLGDLPEHRPLRDTRPGHARPVHVCAHDGSEDRPLLDRRRSIDDRAESGRVH